MTYTLFSHKSDSQRGFTLVELAVVMVIIGILIGGILKGQELIDNSKVTATVSQFKAIETAYNGFVDRYRGQPGDLVNANTRLEECSPGNACVVHSSQAAGIGNSVITGMLGQAAAAMATGGTGGAGNEAGAFFIQLAKAGFLTGVSGRKLNTDTANQFGVTHPVGAIGGGFFVGDARNTGTHNNFLANELQARPYVTLMSGLNLSADNSSNMFGVATILQAYTLDTRLDDGRPGTGNVIEGNADTGNGNCRTNTPSSTSTTRLADSVNAEYDLDSNASRRRCPLGYKL